MVENQHARRTEWQGLVFVLCVMIGLLSIGRVLRAAPTKEAVLRCDPEVSVAEIGETVSFTIYVQDIADLYAADVRMNFDPTIAQVVDANAAKPGTQIEMLDEFLSLDFVVRDVADNALGTIWYANTQVNPSQPVSGSGPLARVTMQSIAAGNFDMPFTVGELIYPNGDLIETTARNCRVTFFDPNAISQTFLPVGIAP